MNATTETAQPIAGTARGTSWAAQIAFAYVTVGMLMPFVAKPFNIDDPFYLAVAKHILTDPFDFYGFEMNWYGTLAPVTYANHTPLTAYYMALIGLIAGFGEMPMHVAFMIPAVGFMLGTYNLARRLCAQPALATAAAGCCPAVFLSATNVMTDVWMACFFVWALALWLRGIDENRLGLLAGAVILAALAALTKFFGVSVIMLMAVYAIGRRRPILRWAPWLLFPVAVLVAYEELTRVMYGQGLLSGTAAYADWGRAYLNVPNHEWLLSGLSFAGGSLAAAVLLGVWSWRLRTWVIWAAVFAAVCGGLFAYGRLRGLEIRGADGVDWNSLLLLGVFITAGMWLLWIAVFMVLHKRNIESCLLACWIGGIFVFATFMNWSVTARTLVPMAPAVAIVAVNELTRRGTRVRTAWVAVALAALLSFGIAWTDQQWARSVRSVAQQFNQVFRDYPADVYYQGHWGFQHYADPEVMEPLDVDRTPLKPGDIHITLSNNSGYGTLPAQYSARTERIVDRAGGWFPTMFKDVGAGFYSDVFGPLPFRVGRPPEEVYLVMELSREVLLLRDDSAAGPDP